MKHSQSFRTHGRSAHFIILVFIFVILFYFFPTGPKTELFKGTLPISSDIYQNRSGLVAYVFDDLRLQ